MTGSPPRPPLYACANTPSTSFSGVSRAGSATSASSLSSRSGGSKLLFGEIDTSSDRSSESYASVCNFVLCDSGTFLTFWLNDQCRDTFLSFLSKQDLARLRLVCHDFGVRAATNLFNDLSITFRTSTFTKPARLAALDRIGFHVKTLTLNLPHSHETFLPPLVDPETGAELSYTYTPQLQAPSSTRPKYGDIGTTEILIRQYPPLFHAATNVSAFVRAFSSLVNLSHLAVSCPEHDVVSRYRRNVVDFMLISLRMAIEQNCLNALDTLTLKHIHPGGLLYLSPILGYGATPRSASRWARIQHLSISLQSLPANENKGGEPDESQLFQTYLRNFQTNLKTLHVKWEGPKGPFAVPTPPPSTSSSPSTDSTDNGHPALRQTTTTPPGRRARSLSVRHFPRLHTVHFENMTTSADEIHAFVAAHRRTLVDINMEDFELTSGSWDDALLPLTRSVKNRTPTNKANAGMAPTSPKTPHAASTTASSTSAAKVDLLELPILLSPAAMLQPSVFVPPVSTKKSRINKDHHMDLPSRVSRLTSWLPRPKGALSPILARPPVFDRSRLDLNNHKLTPCRKIKESSTAPACEGPLKKVLHRVHWL